MKVNTDWILKTSECKLTPLELVPIKGTLLLKVKIEKGSLHIGDRIIITYIDKEGNEHLIHNRVKLIYIMNMQQVPVALQGEEALINTSLPNYITVADITSIKGYRDYIIDSAIAGFLLTIKNKKIQENVYNLVESNITVTDSIITKMFKEDIFRDLANKGLRAVLNNKGKIGLGLAIAWLSKKLWDKYSDPCNRPFRNRKERLNCIAQAANRVANELRREEAVCNQLQDPIQKRKCLYKVDKLRRQWLQKSAELRAKLMSS